MKKEGFFKEGLNAEKMEREGSWVIGLLQSGVRPDVGSIQDISILYQNTFLRLYQDTVFFSCICNTKLFRVSLTCIRILYSWIILYQSTFSWFILYLLIYSISITFQVYYYPSGVRQTAVNPAVKQASCFTSSTKFLQVYFWNIFEKWKPLKIYACKWRGHDFLLFFPFLQNAWNFFYFRKKVP